MVIIITKREEKIREKGVKGCEERKVKKPEDESGFWHCADIAAFFCRHSPFRGSRRR